MKQLEKNFIGKGQVKGFIFTQIKKSDNAYIYEVVDGSNLRYEVFNHKLNTRFGCVTYPSNKAFGIWAFTTPSFKRALEIFEDLSIVKEVNNG
jgi:hypothetical protein